MRVRTGVDKLDRFSLVIVTWNGDGVLKTCLESVRRVYGRLPETVVVDNAGLDSTRRLVEAFPGVKYVPLPENRGFAGGNNAALPHCTREFLLLLNNDTELDGDAFSPLVDFMDAHPDCGAAQGTVKLARARQCYNGCGGFLNPLGTLAFDGFYEKDVGQFATPRRVFTVGGCFFMTRRTAIDSCGRLFYDHFKSYYEEIDYCHRLNLAGWSCWYVPTPTVWHWEMLTSSRFARVDVLAQYYRNIWFSFLTCFGFWARWRFGGTLAMLCVGQVVMSLVRGNMTPLRAHGRVLRRIVGDVRLIRETRTAVRAIRKLSDAELLRVAVKRQPWSYYRRLLGLAK